MGLYGNIYKKVDTKHDISKINADKCGECITINIE